MCIYVLQNILSYLIKQLLSSGIRLDGKFKLCIHSGDANTHLLANMIINCHIRTYKKSASTCGITCYPYEEVYMGRKLLNRRYEDALVVLFGNKEGLKSSGINFNQIYSRINSLSNNLADTTQLE